MNEKDGYPLEDVVQDLKVELERKDAEIARLRDILDDCLEGSAIIQSTATSTTRRLMAELVRGESDG